MTICVKERPSKISFSVEPVYLQPARIITITITDPNAEERKPDKPHPLVKVLREVITPGDTLRFDKLPLEEEVRSFLRMIGCFMEGYVVEPGVVHETTIVGPRIQFRTAPAH